MGNANAADGDVCVTRVEGKSSSGVYHTEADMSKKSSTVASPASSNAASPVPAEMDSTDSDGVSSNHSSEEADQPEPFLKRIKRTAWASWGVKRDEKACDACGYAIEGSMSLALGKRYHPKCFTCAMCNVPMSDSRFFSLGDNDANKYYCTPCYDRHFNSQVVLCGVCTEPIKSTSKAFTSRHATYHELCFQCSHCACSLQAGVPFCSKPASSGQGVALLCNPCGDKLKKPAVRSTTLRSTHTARSQATDRTTTTTKQPAGSDAMDVDSDTKDDAATSKQCAKCSGNVQGVSVRTNGMIFHSQCFSCATCQQPLLHRTYPYAYTDML